MAWLGAVGLASETELIRDAILLEEEPEHASRRQAACQCSSLLVCARPRAVQQLGHAARVVERDVGGGPATSEATCSCAPAFHIR